MEGNQNIIPKVIHCVWLSGEDKPQLLKDCINSWKRVMPDFEIREWGMNEVRSINSPFLKDAIHYKKWAFATDFLRVYILYHFGGIYMDMDVYVYKSFTPFLMHSAFSGIEFWPTPFCATINKKKREDVKGIGIDAAIIGAVKGHQWIKDILSYYDNKRFSPNPKIYMGMIMPNIIAGISSNLYGFKPLPIFQVLKDEVYLYPPDVFSATYKNPLPMVDSHNAYLKYGEYNKVRFSCHLCANSWGYQPHKTIKQKIFSGIKKVLISLFGRETMITLKRHLIRSNENH